MKLSKIIITLALITGNILFSFAQTNQEHNQLDDKGNKQGYWEKHHRNGNLQYTGFFKNNKPVGVFKRFDEDGVLKVELNYSENSNKVFAKFYYPELKLQAEGYYIQQKKDSIWNYYSIDGFLINSVPYVNDQIHGIEKKFFEKGSIYETSEWKNGVVDGLTIRYYENGTVMMRIFYMNGIMDGEYSVYGINENILIQGQYENNRREGKWIYFKEDGSIEKEINYINGKAENEEELKKLETEYIEMLEKNKGKFQDPRDQMYNEIPPM